MKAQPDLIASYTTQETWRYRVNLKKSVSGVHFQDPITVQLFPVSCLVLF